MVSAIESAESSYRQGQEDLHQMSVIFWNHVYTAGIVQRH